LDTAGRGAEQIAELFYWMAGSALVVWIVVIGLAVYAMASQRAHSRKSTVILVIGGGAVVPTVLLACLLCYGLSLMPSLHRPAPDGSLRIRVSGVRWWWRIEYGTGSDGFETANEINLPVDQPVEFQLVSEDVIHSFWIPSLGGKMDMIPGRQNRLALYPTRCGTFAGVCAEMCGTAHAQMGFRVNVQQQDAFDRWMVQQAAPAVSPATDSARRGAQIFLDQGCSACHAIRGTEADGVVGPDLTHFATRATIGAGVLANTPENLARWIVDTHQVKPGVQMPAFDSLNRDDGELTNSNLADLVSYLTGLR
jgi:cytochrome c oxidase subunit 2